MQFLESWTELAVLDLLRLLVPAGLLLTAVLIPGMQIGRLAALGVAVAIPFLWELGIPPAFAAGWCGLWLLIAWNAGGQEGTARRPLAATHGVLEAGTVGLLLGLGLLALLVTAIARQDLSPEDGRRASYGALLLVLGLLQLMLRRHLRRAAVAFGSLGLGLQVLDGAARESQLPGTAPSNGGVLLATILAVALTVRMARSRERQAGTAWVSDAHDLHD